MSKGVKILLTEKEIPRAWYNIAADLEEPLRPPLNPVTGEPVKAEELMKIFAEELVHQEMCNDKAFIEIPEEVREHYKLWRPTPLFRAVRLEKELDTPAHIYYKYEGVSPAGSHKLNTAIPQAYYNKKQGIKRLSTETGAGQWGSALAIACRSFGIKCTVYMVKISYQQKPYRKIMMQLNGAEVFESPSVRTKEGRKILQEDPLSNGSLGIAISEAVEDALNNEDTNYTLGSVLNHVLLHQTIIGQEAIKQMEKADEYPDIVIACSGGGSNFGGLAFPFVRDKIKGISKAEIIAVEPASCPSLTRGKYAYDYGDTAHLTPKMMMYTLGSGFMPPGIHAGGLRYHGASPIVSKLLHDGIIQAKAYSQLGVFEAGVLFAQTEGIVPAPESAHAIKSAVNEAIKAREAGEKKTILFCLSGHGYFDMSAYENYLSGKLEDYDTDDEPVSTAVAALG